MLENKSQDKYSERFMELLIKRRDYGLTEQEMLELKEKCQKAIETINWELRK